MRPKREIVEFSTGDKVGIYDFIKTPEELRELKEIQKWIGENWHLFPKEKITQGTRKMKQLLEDARRDTRFAKNLKKIVQSEPPYKPRELYILYAKYRWFLVQLQEFRKKHLLKNSSYKLKKMLCKKYGIEPLLFNSLGRALIDGRLEGWDFNEESSADVCIVEPQKYNNEPYDIPTFYLELVQEVGSKVYPIKIKIHEFTSKRDVLDFVEKKWDEISPHLTKKRKRRRKLPREVVDFIWKHRAKKAKRIEPLLKEKFPKISLIYFEINKILNEEKKRRGVK